jgi:hypothetical protein
MADEPEQPPITPFDKPLQGRWPAPDDLTAVFANQMALQFLQGSVVLTFGQLAPPVLSGLPEEQRAQSEEFAEVPIRSLGKFVVPLEAFQQTLQR